MYFGFAWQNTGDGDYLNVTVDGELPWPALGMDFAPDQIYFGRIASARVAGKTVGSVNVSSERMTALSYYAIDEADNQEAPKNLTLKTDGLSGIASSTCQPISGPANSFRTGYIRR